MKIPAILLRHLPWFNLPAAVLVALLQRTPVLRVSAAAREILVASPVGSVLRSAVAALGSLGAVHALAGATVFATNRPSPVNGTVGAAVPAVTFTVTGGQAPPGSFRISGQLPPGVNVAGINGNGVLEASSGAIIGTPTAAGLYSVSILAFQFNNAQGDSYGPLNITYNIAAGALVSPTITTQPANLTVNAGGVATFSVVTTGNPLPAFQWRKNGADIFAATASSLTLTNVQASDAAAYSVVVSNSAGIVTSNGATLTVNGGVTAPSFSVQPVSQTIASGATVVFSAATSGTALTTFQWRRDGVNLPGATSPTLVLSGASALAGSYSVLAASSGGSTPSNAASLTLSSSANVGRLINLAIRSNAGTGAQTLIVGFAIGGAGVSGAKPLLLRGVGPALTQFGLTGVLADPVATLFQGTTTIATNDNWAGDAQVAARTAQVGAFAFASVASADAALAMSPAINSYTMQVTGKNNGTGLALAEIYDGTATADFSATTPRLVNVSARTQVGTGGDILIAGFVIGGTTSKTVLIRATGPALAAFGVTGTLVDPKLTLFSGSTVVKENDDWGGDAQIASVGLSVGAFAIANPASKDAVLLVTLAPGSYTAQVSGASNGIGVALVEVYEVP